MSKIAKTHCDGCGRQTHGWNPHERGPGWFTLYVKRASRPEANVPDELDFCQACMEAASQVLPGLASIFPELRSPRPSPDTKEKEGT